MLTRLICAQVGQLRIAPRQLNLRLSGQTFDSGRRGWASRSAHRTCQIPQPDTVSRRVCVCAHAGTVTEPLSHAVINFYHLSDIAKPGETAAKHKELIQEMGWDIRGRIYLSFQGINAQFSGPRKDALAYTSWLACQAEFQGLVWREYPVEKHMFPKLRLKFRPNLISLRGGMQDLPVTEAAARATPLAPSEWKSMLRDAQPPSAPSASTSATGTSVSRAPVVLDVRNSYEWDAGHFAGADRPVEDAFHETPRGEGEEEALPEHLRGADPETPVMMYCTGGIRCDVYSTLLRQRGFRNLYSLEGGIQNYLEHEGSEHWRGALYVFDDRMAVAPSHLYPGGAAAAGAVSAASAGCSDCDDSDSEVSASGGVPAGTLPQAAAPCAVCGGAPELPHINCANVDCNLLVLVCAGCREELQGCCCETCRDNAPRLLRPIKDGAYRSMTNYAPKQRGALQRLLTPERAAKLAAARARRRERIRRKQDERQILKQQRKQLARQAMAKAESPSGKTADATAKALHEV